jgi:hypothetical protein
LSDPPIVILNERFTPRPRRPLTPAQRVALRDALTPASLSPRLCPDIEDALGTYRLRRHGTRGTRRAVEREILRLEASIEHATKLLAICAHADLQELLQTKLQRWEADRTAFRLENRPRHHPADGAILNLGYDVVDALKAHAPDVPLQPSRIDSQLIDLLRLVRQWADAIDGRAPRPFVNLYRYSTQVLQQHRTGRRFTELDPLAVLR